MKAGFPVASGADPQARRRAQAADPDRSGLVEALDTLVEPTSRRSDVSAAVDYQIDLQPG